MPNATLINLNDANPAATLGCADVAWQKGNVYATTVNVNGQTITVDAANVSAQIRNLGGVDPRTTTAETIALASQGKLVTITNASAVVITLNSAAVTSSFYCAVENLGAGTATLIPTSGTVNGAATLDVATGTGGWLFFDGANWKAVIGGGGGAFTPGGDLVGSSTDQTVVGIQTIPVSATPPTSGQVLTYDLGDGEWEPKAPTGGGGGGTGALTEVALAPTDAGDFTIAHGITGTPSLALVQMDSDGSIWFQSPTRYDGTNLYLVASCGGITGKAEIWGSTGVLVNFRDGIVPTGDINGFNITFTLPEAPNPPESLMLVQNGVALEAGLAYTLVGLTITYAVAPPIGATHVCWYRY